MEKPDKLHEEVLKTLQQFTTEFQELVGKHETILEQYRETKHKADKGRV